MRTVAVYYAVKSMSFGSIVAFHESPILTNMMKTNLVRNEVRVRLYVVNIPKERYRIDDNNILHVCYETVALFLR